MSALLRRVPRYRCITACFPVIHWRTFGIFHLGLITQKSCCDYFHTGFCMNISVHFSGINAQKGNVWLAENCMFSFIRNCQAVFQSDCTLLHSQQRWMRDRFSAYSSALGVAAIFYFSCSSRCAVISHCRFFLHLPGSYWCWTPFYVLVCCLHFLSGKRSVHVFAYFPFFELHLINSKTQCCS